MSKMNKCFSVLVLLLAITSISFAAKKVVLLEQFTGAWCGYCPDGSLIMDDIIKNNPGSVIGVKIHNGDAMAIPEENAIGSALGLPGYPTGMVDRLLFTSGSSNIYFLDRGAWAQAVTFALQEPAMVDLKLDWYYDESSGMINATIKGKFDQAITDEIRFNVYVVEDNIPAVGQGYTQRNYYNTDPNSPLYQKGDPMKDYNHMKVVRTMMGGPWGEAGSIPTPVAAGNEVQYQFSVNKAANWDIKNIHLIGSVQYATPQKKQIINAVEGVSFKPKTQITVTGNKLFAIPKGTTNTTSISIKNTSTSPIEYEIKTANSVSSWNFSITPEEYSFVIQPGGTKTLEASYTPTSIGVGTAKVIIEEVDGNSFLSAITGYTSDAELAQIMLEPSGNDYGILNTITALNDYKDMISIPISDFVALNQNFNNLQIAYWCLGEDGVFSADQSAIISRLITNKTSLLFTGPLTYNSLHATMPTLESQFGLSYIAPEYSGQSTGIINLKGVDGDPIGDGFASTSQLTHYLPMKVRITNPATTFATINIASKADTILGTRTELSDGTRLAFFSFNVAGIQNATAKTNLMKNTLNWLLKIQVNKPKIVLSTSNLDFGEVATDSSAQKTFTVQNTGTADLVISSATITNNADNSFAIIQAPSTTIAPGASSDMIIQFAPKDLKLYISPKIEIVSNDPNNSTLSLTLRGRGVEPSSISRDILSYFNVTPNVVSDNAEINFAISSPVPQNVKVYVMDLSGRKIVDIVDGIYSYGEYKLELPAANLNSGAFFVVAQIGDAFETVRINVIK
jgi:hypothetical protein